MDYTTASLVKTEVLRTSETADDAIIATVVTAASRAIDRHCTGAMPPASDDYFELESVAGQIITGTVNKEGTILCYPRKPVVTAVSTLSYRSSPQVDWIDVDLDAVEIDGGVVRAWLNLGRRGDLRVKISFTGGLATDAGSLPADLVEAATVLAGRFYKEAEAGLNDAIGTADGVLLYTKAFPPRLVKMLKSYKRWVKW